MDMTYYENKKKSNEYLILDTNIWVHKTKLLSNPMGAALASIIKRNQRVGVSDID